MDNNRNTRKRVVLYCRVATQTQSDDFALGAQSARLHQQAERNGLEVVGEIRAYEKGITLDRPGWHKVLCLAAEQKADAIMVTELDRVARGMLLLTEAFTELDKRDLQLHASATDLPFTPSFKQYIL